MTSQVMEHRMYENSTMKSCFLFVSQAEVNIQLCDVIYEQPIEYVRAYLDIWNIRHFKLIEIWKI